MLLREDAACEVKLLMSALPPEVLTGVEILAVLAILCGAKESSTRSSGRWRRC
jgi:hypothetical protein